MKIFIELFTKSIFVSILGFAMFIGMIVFTTTLLLAGNELNKFSHLVNKLSHLF